MVVRVGCRECVHGPLCAYAFMRVYLYIYLYAYLCVCEYASVGVGALVHGVCLGCLCVGGCVSMSVCA